MTRIDTHVVEAQVADTRVRVLFLTSCACPSPHILNGKRSAGD